MTAPPPEREEVIGPTILVGYARRSTANQTVRLSLNTHALEDCETYQTSDGQNYIALEIGIESLNKILDGTRTVTTIAQRLEGY